MPSPFFVALVRPFNLSILVLAVFAGLLGAWWLFPLGLVCWGVMLWSTSQDPAVRISQAVQRRVPLAPRFQHVFDRIERAQVGIFNAVAGADGRVQRVLRPIEQAATDLTEQVYRLGQRMTAQENYRRVTEATSDIAGDMARLRQKTSEAGDAPPHLGTEDMRRALEVKQMRFRAVVAQLDRFETMLNTVALELEGALAEVIQLQSLEANQVSPRASDLMVCLQQRLKEVATFEKNAPRG